MRSQLVLTAAAVLMGSTGCMMDRVDEPLTGTTGIISKREPRKQDNSAYQPFTNAKAGLLHGAIGQVAVNNHPADKQSLYDDGYYTSVETAALTDDHAVMTLLSVIDGPAVFTPGFSGTFNWETEASQAGPQVSMIGCVGQEMDVYDQYDMPADEVIVDVSENAIDENAVDVLVVGQWKIYEDGVPTDAFHEATTKFTLAR